MSNAANTEATYVASFEHLRRMLNPSAENASLGEMISQLASKVFVTGGFATTAQELWRFFILFS